MGGRVSSEEKGWRTGGEVGRKLVPNATILHSKNLDGKGNLGGNQDPEAQEQSAGSSESTSEREKLDAELELVIAQ